MKSKPDTHKGPAIGSIGVRQAGTLAAIATAVCLVAGPQPAPSAYATPPNSTDAVAYTTNAPVHAITYAQGRTYVGGDFTRVGRRAGAGVVLSASGASEAFPEVAGGEVRTAVSDHEGGWYIGGTFMAVGGQRRLGLAHVTAGGQLDPDFHPAVTDSSGHPSPVNALAYSKSPDASDPYADEGTLYAAGEFTRIGDEPGEVHQHIAAVDGHDGTPVTTWGPTTSCTPQPCSPTVHALALAHVPLAVDGAVQEVPVLLLGGSFNRAGAIDAPATAPALTAFWGVNALNSAGDSIEASVVTAGGMTPGPWAPFASGFSTPTVRALQISGRKDRSFAVYVGGANGAAPLLEAWQLKFSSAEGRAADGPAKFSQWNPGPQSCEGPRCVPSVLALALRESNSPGDSFLYFGGEFSALAPRPPDTTPIRAQRVAKIPAVPDPADTTAPASPVTATALGEAGAAVRALAVARDGSSLYLAGDFAAGLSALDATGGTATAWDPRPDARALTVTTDPSTAAVYAGGQFTSLGSVPRGGLAAFDSSGALLDWAPRLASSDADRPALVRALAVAGETVYAGGQFDSVTSPSGTQEHANLAALDAVSGEPKPAFDPDPSQSGGSPEVIALSATGSKLYVGGRFDGIAGQARANIAALDLSNGAASPWNPGANGNVNAILPACGVVYVGGGFTRTGGQARNYIAALDPAVGLATPWNPDAGGAVLTLAAFGPTIYAGGNFATIGGGLRQKAAGLAVSDASATAFDPGSDGPVRALAIAGSTVYAGGTFFSIGGASRSRLASLDPSTGQALGWDPAPEGRVDAITVGDDNLYVGGGFSAVGPAPQRGFAPFTSGAGAPFVPTTCEAVSNSGAASPEPPPLSAPAPRPVRREPPVRARALVVTPATLHLGGRPLVVRFWVSRAVRVALRFERRTATRCSVGRGERTKRRCSRWTKFASMTGRARRGTNRLRFPGQRVARRRLVPGSYRLVLRTIPGGSGAGAGQIAYFKVLPG